MADERRPLLFLDACCAINLLATDLAGEILSVLPYRFAVARLVAEREVIYLPGEKKGAGEEEPPDHPVMLRPLVEDGLLEVMSPAAGPEITTYVDLALQLDDGEAMSAALAIHRGGRLATDDRKAIRIIGETEPSLVVIRTARLMREWAEAGSVSEEGARMALKAIEERASFLPPRADPDQDWWWRLVSGSTRSS